VEHVLFSIASDQKRLEQRYTMRDTGSSICRESVESHRIHENHSVAPEQGKQLIDNLYQVTRTENQKIVAKRSCQWASLISQRCDSQIANSLRFHCISTKIPSDWIPLIAWAHVNSS
jgi:hypothetical protein